MGQNVCCMRQPPSSENEPKEASPYDSNFSTPASSISSMKTDKEKMHLIRPATNSTLGECLMMASPPQVNIGGAPSPSGDQRQVMQMLYQKFQPSSPDVQTDFLTPRISFSSDKLGLLGKIDEEEDEGSCGGSVSPRTPSGKMKKRVSFKLPEAADIIIFYSPKETLEEF